MLVSFDPSLIFYFFLLRGGGSFQTSERVVWLLRGPLGEFVELLSTFLRLSKGSRDPCRSGNVDGREGDGDCSAENLTITAELILSL